MELKELADTQQNLMSQIGKDLTELKERFQQMEHMVSGQCWSTFKQVTEDYYRCTCGRTEDIDQIGKEVNGE